MATVDKVNGRRYSHSSLQSDFAGLLQKGIVEVSFSDTLEPGVAKGTAPDDQGTTIGDYKAKCSVTFLKEEHDKVVAAKAAASGTNSWLGDSENVTLSWAETGKPLTSVLLVDFRMKGGDESSKGSDAATVKVECYVRGICRKPPGAQEWILPFPGFEITPAV